LPRRFWQCQPPGYVAPPLPTNSTAGQPTVGPSVGVNVTLTLTGVAATEVNTAALAAGMQRRITSDLAYLNVTNVTVTAAAVAGTTTRRRLFQAVTNVTLVAYRITVPLVNGTAVDVLAEAVESSAEGALKDRAFLLALLREVLSESELVMVNLDQVVTQLVDSVSGTNTDVNLSPSLSPSPSPLPSPAPGSYGYGNRGGYYGR
jgi:hypothetical protein